mgnify:CR=1 FL=1
MNFNVFIRALVAISSSVVQNARINNPIYCSVIVAVQVAVAVGFPGSFPWL